MPTTSEQTVWLTAAEAAVKAGKSERSIQRYAAEGKVRSRTHPMSGRLMIDAADLERLIAGAPVGPPVEPTAPAGGGA